MKTIISLLLLGSGILASSDVPAPTSTRTTVPASIVFNREVIQQINGEDGKKEITYYFSIDGEYAAMKPDMSSGGDEMSLMVYASDGTTLFFNDNEKTITVMKMAKVIGEGAQMSMELAGKMGQKALKKDKENIKVNLTGKTKTICGYPAVEYEVKNEGGKCSWYYAKVDFNPIKIYTMGAGNAGAINTKKAEMLKDNPMGIPVLNKNYLLAEISLVSATGKELITKSITKKNIVISTTGYKIRDFSHKSIGEMISSQKKGN